MGGEKRGLEIRRQAGRGSPPHGRGKGRCGVKGQRPFRITPAWAGKSRFGGLHMSVFSMDHPRMGGEKVLSGAVPHLKMGSPPHGRGKVPQRRAPCCSAGITPAWAGKSSSRKSVEAMARDHPRMGGEKPQTAHRVKPQHGSPPHGRGKVGKDKAGHLPAGITPAWAGKSLARELLLIVSRDHPRMGGEKRLRAWPSVLHMGSPPHGRGKDK